MRYLALATDYDGTIAQEGRVDAATREALQRLRASGRKLILVTGRELEDLQVVFDRLDLFEWVIAENGALLFCPGSREEKVLGERPPDAFITALRERGVPVSVGRVIVATWEPYARAVLEAIHDRGLELQIIFNKDAVMVLPPGVTKATGLAAALREMGLSPDEVVGVGDAENDLAFLELCGCSAAVANALPAIKGRAAVVLQGDHGAGVRELIDRILQAGPGDEQARHGIVPEAPDEGKGSRPAERPP